MSGFETLLDRWRTADALACDQERALGASLDRYCAGQAQAPAIEEIARARRLRAAASKAQAVLLHRLRSERDSLDWL